MWHIGRQLRAYRAHNNLDQIDMGRILGLSPTTVSSVESGSTIRTPAARRIRAFLKAQA
jgi:transcriptional regulator with XRE-family HTH domain